MKEEMRGKIMEWGKKFNLSWTEEKELYDFISELFIQARQEAIEEFGGKVELWFLRLHNEPEKWTVEQALASLK